MMVIENEIQLKQIQTDFSGSFVFPVPKNMSNFSEGLSLLFIHDYKTNDSYSIALEHQEFKSNITLDVLKSLLSFNYVIASSKYIFDYYFPSKFSTEFPLLYWLNNGDTNYIEDLYSFSSKFKRFYYPSTLYNMYIPYYMFVKCFNSQVSFLSTLEKKSNVIEKYTSILSCLNHIRDNGIYIDIPQINQAYNKKLTESLLHPKYSLYNATGRPVGTCKGINLSAIPKDEEHRLGFISRHDKGMLVEFDIKSFHLYLIAKANGFKLKKDDIHMYLAKMYFNKDIISPQEYDEAKKITFTNIYSERGEAKKIPFFDELYKYRDNIYKEMVENKEIEVPYCARTLKLKNLKDDYSYTKGKLFSYVIQLMEVEHFFDIIKKIIVYLQSKKTKIVLYVYDSFLLDFDREDGLETLKGIQKIINDSGFISSVKIGKNYFNMKSFDLENVKA